MSIPLSILNDTSQRVFSWVLSCHIAQLFLGPATEMVTVSLRICLLAVWPKCSSDLKVTLFLILYFYSWETSWGMGLKLVQGNITGNGWDLFAKDKEVLTFVLKGHFILFIQKCKLKWVWRLRAGKRAGKKKFLPLGREMHAVWCSHGKL